MAARFVRLATMAAPIVGLGCCWATRAVVFDGGWWCNSWPWLTQIGLNLSFRLDGPRISVFAAADQGIGILVIL